VPMPKWCFNRGFREALLVIICFTTCLTVESSPIRAQRLDYCQGGKQVRRMSASFTQRVPRPPQGVPLDLALEREKLWVQRIRNEAREYFRSSPSEDLVRMMQDYTFLMPEAIREGWGLGDLDGMSGISMAVKYRRYFWKVYLEKFTTVKEAAGGDPYTMRFEVDLDLGMFCRYRQPMWNLVTGG